MAEILRGSVTVLSDRVPQGDLHEVVYELAAQGSGMTGSDVWIDLGQEFSTIVAVVGYAPIGPVTQRWAFKVNQLGTSGAVSYGKLGIKCELAGSQKVQFTVLGRP